MNKVQKISLAVSAVIALGGCAGASKMGMPGSLGDLTKGLGGGSAPSSPFDTAKSLLKDANDALRDIPESEEIELGDGMAAGLLGASPLLANDSVQRYVNQVGKWIALNSERPNLPWTFAVIDSQYPNAFAAPGGKVFITTGLLYSLKSESELAGALAHEIAHVIMKHHLRAVKKGGWASLGTTALGAVADRKIGNRGLGGEVGKSWVKGSISGMKELYVKGLPRDDEFQADRAGMVLAARSGYDPYGLPVVLQLLHELSGHKDAGKSLLYRSHPPMDVRLTALDESLGATLEKYSTQPRLPDRFRSYVPVGNSAPPPPAATPATPAKTPTAPAKAPVPRKK